MLSSSYTATWSSLRTSARKQSSESVGEIVSEETCSFGVRSGFPNFYPNFFQSHFPNFSKEFGKIGLEKKFGKKWFRPVIILFPNSASPIIACMPPTSLFILSIHSTLFSPRVLSLFFDKTNAHNFLLNISTNNNTGVKVSPFFHHNKSTWNDFGFAVIL